MKTSLLERGLLVSAIAFCCTSHAAGREVKTACPLHIDSARNVPPGWTVVPVGEVGPAGAGMLHGPPQEAGYLVPVESHRHGKGKHRRFIQRWKFDHPHWFETWMFCSYSEQPEPVALFRRIAQNTSECTLTTSVKTDIPEINVFVCK